MKSDDIKNRFGDWYREVHIEPTSDLLNNRWEGVLKYSAKKKSVNKILNLIRCLYGVKPIESIAFYEEFSETFQKFDPVFSVRNEQNSFEARLLSGVILVNLIVSKQSPLSDFVAMGIICYHSQGLREIGAFNDFLLIAQDHLKQGALDARHPVTTHNPMPNFDSESIVKTINPADPSNNLTILWPTITKILKTIDDRFQETSKRTEILQKNLVFQQEETNILWWVFSENSREFKVNFSALDKYHAWFTAAKELNELIIELPAPVASHAFLRKTLFNCGIAEETKFTIQKVIDSLPEDKKVSLINGYDATDIGDFFPLHTAILRSSEAGGGGDWSSLFENVCKISNTASLEPIRFSIQYFEEKLFRRFHSMVNQL